LRCYYGSLLSDKAEYLAVDPIWEPESHWDDHPDYCVADWQYDVSEGNTRQSYIEWVNSAMAADADERHHTGGGK